MSWSTVLTAWLASLPGWLVVLAGVVVNARKSRAHVEAVTRKQTSDLGDHLAEVTHRQTLHLEQKIEAAATGDGRGRTT